MSFPENATDSERNIKWQKITEISQNHHFLGSLSRVFLFLEVHPYQKERRLAKSASQVFCYLKPTGKQKTAPIFYQSSHFYILNVWSRLRDLNSRPLPYHGSALPLS